MRLPRDLSGDDLAKVLRTLEYGQHHVTIPRTNPLRIGTLAGILTDIAGHFKMSREELIKKIF